MTNGDTAMTNCGSSVNYVYDEDLEYYICLVDLDEDETHRFIHCSTRDCPYFRLDDEYSVEKHQM